MPAILESVATATLPSIIFSIASLTDLIFIERAELTADFPVLPLVFSPHVT